MPWRRREKKQTRHHDTDPALWASVRLVTDIAMSRNVDNGERREMGRVENGGAESKSVGGESGWRRDHRGWGSDRGAESLYMPCVARGYHGAQQSTFTCSFAQFIQLGWPNEGLAIGGGGSVTSRQQRG